MVHAALQLLGDVLQSEPRARPICGEAFPSGWRFPWMDRRTPTREVNGRCEEGADRRTSAFDRADHVVNYYICCK